ncbi:MAG TPA: hypothetical protein VE684_05405 [Crenalkalicoccus sp.]|jgi:hypothetical protein|nr:hypothetical protein [Crenalkalicoccus sp.]
MRHAVLLLGILVAGCSAIGLRAGSGAGDWAQRPAWRYTTQPPWPDVRIQAPESLDRA